MGYLIKRALESRVFANLFAGLLVLLGFIAIQNITVKLFPELNIEAINVSVVYPGASPSEVEEAVVIPIEEQLEGLEGIRKITSSSSENIGSVLVSLNAGEDMNVRLNDIQNEIDQITVFPQRAERPVVAIADPDELAIQVVLTGPVDANRIKQEANRIRDRLVDSASISDVRIESAPEYLIDILVEQDTLREYQLSLPQIASLVRQQSLELSGGEIESDQSRQLVRTLGENKRGEEFENVIIRTGDNGATLRLDQIATVTDGLSDDPKAGYYNGQPAVVLSVYRVGTEQIFDVVEQTRSVLKQAEQTGLPLGIEAVVWRDESSNLSSRIDLLTRNAVIGLALVALLLMLTLDLRIARWVAFGVGVSFVGSFTLLSLTGYTINQLSLFGFILAIGIVVDDAIVVGENIFSRKEQGDSPMEAAHNGVSQVAMAVLISTLTTVAVFLPLLFIPGIYGQFMGPIAAVVIFVLILSLIEAFFILPKHLSNLHDKAPGSFSLRRIADPAREWTAAKLKWLTDNPVTYAVDKAVRYPLLMVGTFIAAFMLSLLLIVSGAVKFVFFPSIEGNYVTAQLVLSNRASDVQTRDEINFLEKTAQQAAESFSPSQDNPNDTVIDGIFSTRGVKIGGGDPNASTTSGSASNLAYVTVKIEDSATRTFSAVDFERAWRETSGQIPGAKQLTFSSNLVSAGAAVAIEVRSRDEQKAREVTGKLREALEGIDGVTDIRDDRFNTTEEVQISLKPEALNYGVNLETLATQVRAAFFGAEATRIQRDREEIEVRVRLSNDARSTLDTLNETRITVEGQAIPLSAVANVTIGDSPASIARKNGRRVITLSSDVDTRVITGGEVTSQLLEQTWAELKPQYPDVSVGVGGDQEEQQRAGPAIAMNFVVSLFAIYALLALVFGSYSQPIIIMSIIPFGFMGALLGHFLLGFDLTLLSMFGVIGLSGVIINDGLLLVEFINAQLEKGKEIVEAVKQATLQRFRPILLTSLTTFLGVTPIIFERSVQAKFLAPTAVSLGIGILFGTVILIFLLPAVAVLQLKLKRKLAGSAA
ncbi:efflux RND transporter permease subunit [Alteromonas oceanisediminis]|uniref:efflux RND transporter permease subunit n=1 Tax=Alteromonas oceanisediminis TaxID=2836180 RepID=UPI001BDA4BDD|nr:efflux RND transporter permease subunit [Alteromonas oceanisediminis]MBT0587748.1 efflux RND transporter permease subunit [Alteromonas oceanisediminis]